MKTTNLSFVLIFSVLLLFNYGCQPSATAEPEVITELPMTSQSDEAKAEFTEGMLAFDLGDRTRARENFEKAIELDPNFALAYLYRSFSSRSSKEFSSDLKIANEKNEGLSEAEQWMIKLGNTYLSGDVNARKTVSDSMLAKFPEMARAYVISGNVNRDLNDIENSRKQYEKAIEVNPDWFLGYSQLGNSYIFEDPKDFAKAEVNMAKTVELLPNESRTHIALGDVYRAQQNLEKALASYTKAAELNPNDEIAYTKAGHANTYMGNFDAARMDFEKAQSMSTYPAAAMNFIANTWLYEGDHAKGLAWLNEQAMNLDSTTYSRDRLLDMQTNMLGNSMWIAYHLGDAAEMKSIMTHYAPMEMEIRQNRGSEEDMSKYSAEMNFINGLIAALEGNYEEADKLAEANKTNLTPINDPNKLEDYHFLKGDIAMRQGNYADAISNFELSGTDDMYSRYKLAMANKMAGNEEVANQLMQEVSSYNFNNIGYALVRKEVKDMLAAQS